MAGEGLTARVSLMRHFDALLRGAFDSSNLAFPVLVILLFLGLSIRQLDKERQHG